MHHEETLAVQAAPESAVVAEHLDASGIAALVWLQLLSNSMLIGFLHSCALLLQLLLST
jgi:hypothetical protein